MPKNHYGISYAILTEVFANLLLYGECLYIERISFWHILYKLIESYLKVITLSEGFSQILQLRFGTSKTIQN